MTVALTSDQEKGNSVRAGRASSTKWFPRRNVCALDMTELITRADDAGELMSERRQRLREAWQKAPRWLFVDAQFSEEIPSAPYLMRFDEA
jgi:hypothetical protein